MDYATARRRALRLLSLRNYHSSVLARKLQSQGAPEEVIERVVADCQRMGFFNDDQAILRELEKGYGPRAIGYKLKLENIEVRKVITREMQKKKIQEMLPRLKGRDKAVRTLQRKGFDFDLIIEIFSSSQLD